MQSVLKKIFTAFTEDSDDLLELAIQSTKEYHAGFIDDNPDWWEQLSKEDRDGLILDRILNYDDDERDLIWWCGRLRLAKELDENLDRLEAHLGFEKETEWGKENPEQSEEYCDGAQQAVDMIFFGG